MKRFNLEIEFSIDHAPYIVLAEGNDLEELLGDAQYNHADSDDGNRYRGIENLPGKHYDEVVEMLAEEVRSREEMCAEALTDR